MLKLLKEFELRKEWTGSNRSLDLLNRAERVALEKSSDGQVQAARIARTKLLQCYTGVKEIAGVMTKHAVHFSPEHLSVRRNPFHILRKYCVR